MSEKVNSVESVVAMSVFQGDRLEWVKEAVESILSQSYTNYLLMIHQDGPVPEAMETYLKSLCENNKQVKLIVSVQNIGLGAALNKIISLAEQFNPKYIIRMDSDDVCFPDRFIKQVHFLDNNADIDILGSSLLEIDEKRKKCWASCYARTSQLINESASKALSVKPSYRCY
ncbi:glycosyltransferase [Psychrosphaera haliotis]|uniref:Glycosyltransferase n=1 Tax=Psychrosphaera haliotis TaxID=555083 RepID=A0A6N8F504_9GAMM|nr:glycosyltransferase [Psychrosphaera haliotis]MUH71363.1 glycosyltransferase [Psychrosphaera haliotis]